MELCPELEGASKYTIWATRYDNETERCYRTGTRGPCGKNMIFYSIANNSVYGECDCNYDIECKSLIYSPVFKECVFAYDQVRVSSLYYYNLMVLLSRIKYIPFPSLHHLIANKLKRVGIRY